MSELFLLCVSMSILIFEHRQEHYQMCSDGVFSGVPCLGV